MGRWEDVIDKRLMFPTNEDLLVAITEILESSISYDDPRLALSLIEDLIVNYFEED